MNRRVVFSIIAGGVAAGAVLWIGGMAAAQIIETRQPATALVAGATTGTPSASASARDDDATPPATTPSPGATDEPSPAETGPDPSDFVPFADRLRAWRPGDHVITLEQIHAFYAVPGRLNDADPTWYQEKAIEAQCMAGKGWYYDPRSDWRLDASHRNEPRPPVDPQAQLALGGDTGAGDAYRWQDAGCDGLAVHETGNDHNN
jgi:hypothetical protein